MTINTYRKGQKVRVTCQFKVNGTLTDPTTVTCKVMDPSRNISTPTPVNQSVGIYYVDIVTDENKEWNVRFEGTGACVAVEELTFTVMSAFP